MSPAEEPVEAVLGRPKRGAALRPRNRDERQEDGDVNASAAMLTTDAGDPVLLVIRADLAPYGFPEGLADVTVFLRRVTCGRPRVFQLFERASNAARMRPPRQPRCS